MEMGERWMHALVRTRSSRWKPCAPAVSGAQTAPDSRALTWSVHKRLHVQPRSRNGGDAAAVESDGKALRGGGGAGGHFSRHASRQHKQERVPAVAAVAQPCHAALPQGYAHAAVLQYPACSPVVVIFEAIGHGQRPGVPPLVEHSHIAAVRRGQEGSGEQARRPGADNHYWSGGAPAGER